MASHPYEEVAYDLIPLENDFPGVGMGMIGELAIPSDEISFLQRIKRGFWLSDDQTYRIAWAKNQYDRGLRWFW